ncbi:MAG: DUF4445 domain-containing protein [Coriobacteriales bacterium]|nr:DUF4445 domain-containing protein [Coriobacteriales bacterium]
MPDSVTIDVAQNENLLRAAMMADVRVTASCGGDGTCGKCRMVVERGSVKAKPSARLTEAQVAEGYVLGCTAEVTGDVVVRIPPESRPGSAPRARSVRIPNPVISTDEQAERVPDKRAHPPVSKRFVKVSEPDHADNASDLSRVKTALRRAYHLKDVEVTIEAARELPSAIREGGWSVTATIMEINAHKCLITGFQPGDTTGRQFAVAVDIGTTTIEVAIVDLASRETVAQATEYNAQVDRGEDVITRIIASTRPGGLEELQHLVSRTVSHLATSLLEEHRIDIEDVVVYIAAGNTVMTHLLLDITPEAIRTSPYVPAATAFPPIEARSVGLPGTHSTYLITMPCPASWLGGDIVAGVVAAGIPWSDKLTLFVDVGTNGEIVLGGKDFLVACSCSAGPAFEGGGITHGMRAAEGAVELVRIDPDTFEPMIITIGNVKPLGICGSGLIDGVSELFLSGAIDRSGKFTTDTGSARIRRGEHGHEYVLVHAEESGTGGDIVLTETDIENLMRAKAAIFAGINVLVESLDLTLDAIEEIVVAGGFGHYLDLERVMALGMFPELPTEHFAFLGNSSLSGARLAAASRKMLEKTSRVAEAMTYLELSVNAGFMEMYTSSLFLPHTDLSLFPKTEELLASRLAEKVT